MIPLPAFLTKPIAKFAAIGLAVVLAVVLFNVWLGSREDAAVELHEQKREAAASVARDTAASERVADAVENTKNEESNHAAIDEAPKGGDLSPAARALSCERLRKLGRIPPACRDQGPD